MNSDSENQSDASSVNVEEKLKRLREIVKDNGYSFEVGDTGLLNEPLSELTGGMKMDSAPEIVPEQVTVEDHIEELKVQGLNSSLQTSEAQPRDINILDVRPPFDWQDHVGKASFDWRTYRQCTPARRQRSCGACWAFASASLYELSLSVFFKRVVDVSEQDIINCGVGGCGGSLLYHGLEYLEKSGAAAESAVGYVGRKEQCDTSVTKCYSISMHGFVNPDMGIPPRDRMKQYIYQWGGVGTFILATDVMVAFKGEVYDEFAATGDNHFVIILGWDDNKAHRKGNGAWLIKNSWGDEWGTNGFAWVPYDANEIGYNAQMLSPRRPVSGCP